MPPPSLTRILGHSTALRTIGQLFDSHGARSVGVEEGTISVSLSWVTRDGAIKTADYPWGELDGLRRIRPIGGGVGPNSRRAEPHESTRGWSALLRTLGQDLDAGAAETSSIAGDLNGLTATWVSAGNYGIRHYTIADLVESGRLRAEQRQLTG